MLSEKEKLPNDEVLCKYNNTLLNPRSTHLGISNPLGSLAYQ